MIKYHSQKHHQLNMDHRANDYLLYFYLQVYTEENHKEMEELDMKNKEHHIVHLQNKLLVVDSLIVLDTPSL